VSRFVGRPLKPWDGVSAIGEDAMFAWDDSAPRWPVSATEIPHTMPCRFLSPDELLEMFPSAPPRHPIPND
jgi:hypothetical protein